MPVTPIIQMGQVDSLLHHYALTMRHGTRHHLLTMRHLFVMLLALIVPVGPDG